MSLILSGNSGSMTVDSTAGVTFPNGTNPQAAPSKVLQVVNAITTSNTSTNSNSYIATSLTASITPLFSTSKILVLINGRLYATTASNETGAKIYRNTTPVYGGYTLFATSGGSASPLTLIYVDSPATTSAVSYTLYISSTVSTSVSFMPNTTADAGASITLMEIAQ